MDIAILHYHLNRGGVTQVIANHLRSLDCEGTCRRVVVLYGGRKEGWPSELADSLRSIEVELKPVSGLDYDEGVAQPSVLAQEITATLGASGLGPNNCILHIHNHSLGKNVSLPGAIDRLAARGYCQLRQIHDFAEDFRPQNYRHLAAGLGTTSAQELSTILYPQRENLHYAVLNGRDHRILSEFGIDGQRLHLLPNPVPTFPSLPERERTRSRWGDLFQVSPSKDLMLYPVRGIRRKNLGESLLWSILAEGGSQVAITLAPLNPVEANVYRHWVEFATSRRLNVSFDVGGEGGMTFFENLSAADAILTTSVAEGFGMVYLEAWLSGRPLVGRDLPEITADFRRHDVDLNYLQPSLRIPIQWVGKTGWRTSLKACFLNMLRQYDLPAPSGQLLDEQISSLVDQELVDFAQLDCRQQSRVLEQTCERSEKRDQLRDINSWIPASLEWRGDRTSDTIDRNRTAIEANYSLEVLGRRLSELYDAVVQRASPGPPTSAPSQRSVLEFFLDITRLSPLRLDR